MCFTVFAFGCLGGHGVLTSLTVKAICKNNNCVLAKNSTLYTFSFLLNHVLTIMRFHCNLSCFSLLYIGTLAFGATNNHLFFALSLENFFYNSCIVIEIINVSGMLMQNHSYIFFLLSVK